jgi:hypothetical protein
VNDTPVRERILNGYENALRHRNLGVTAERLQVRRIIVVADRGITGRQTITDLTEHEQAPFCYIIGRRTRRQKEVTEEVLARAVCFQVVAGNLEVKEVAVGGRGGQDVQEIAAGRADIPRREADAGSAADLPPA